MLWIVSVSQDTPYMDHYALDRECTSGHSVYGPLCFGSWVYLRALSIWTTVLSIVSVSQDTTYMDHYALDRECTSGHSVYGPLCSGSWVYLRTLGICTTMLWIVSVSKDTRYITTMLWIVSVSKDTRYMDQYALKSAASTLFVPCLLCGNDQKSISSCVGVGVLLRAVCACTVAAGSSQHVSLRQLWTSELSCCLLLHAKPL